MEKKNSSHSSGDGRQIMNGQERLEYCEWLTSMGEINQARIRYQQRKAIQGILKFNNAKLFLGERRALNNNENRVFENEGTYSLPSDDWFRSFNDERDNMYSLGDSKLAL